MNSFINQINSKQWNEHDHEDKTVDDINWE